MSGEFSRHRVRFTIEGVGEATGELMRFLAPRTTEALMRAMPIRARLASWKEEAYFETSVKVGFEKEKSRVEKGAVAYWPMCSAICVFYGESQPYSPVNLIGRIIEGLELFRTARQGSRVTIERL